MRACALVICVGLLLGWSEAIADAPQVEEERPRFDPFAHPALERAPRAESAEPPLPEAPVWVPVLRATLVAGPGSMADLGGVVLKLGEAYHGWRLVEVRPWEAVFERDGARVVLPVVAEEHR